VEWNGAKILLYSDRYITTFIPWIRVRNHGELQDTSFALEREPTNKPTFSFFTLSTMAMGAKILTDKKNYAVCVIGFYKIETN
jgi:hypothetical protein